ncbi:MAG: hypothetical protein WC788_07675 [Candidatus Paceibacterota bacterium]|jgi:hypothetical protein
MFEKQSTISFIIEGRYVTEKTGNEYINVRFREVHRVDARLFAEGRRIVKGQRIDAGTLVTIDEIIILSIEQNEKREYDAIVIEYKKFDTLENALEMAINSVGCWVNCTRKMQEYLGDNLKKIGLHNQEVQKLEGKK